MNDSLLTYSGGQPLYADDLSFMQNSLSAMTNHLSKAFGDTYIIWGCLDGGKTNVVEGAVCIGGKLYEVPALGTLGENKLCYREVLSDERVFEDGQKRNVKKSYEAYLSTNTSGAVAYIDLKAVRSADLLIDELEKNKPRSYKYTSAYESGEYGNTLDYEFLNADVENGDWIMFYVGLQNESYVRYFAGALSPGATNTIFWEDHGLYYNITFNTITKRLHIECTGSAAYLYEQEKTFITVFKQA